MNFLKKEQERKKTILKGFGIRSFDKLPEDDLEKGGKKTGTYTDTAENRKKQRVGQKYSKDKEAGGVKEKPAAKETGGRSKTADIGKPDKEGWSDVKYRKDKKGGKKPAEGGKKAPEDHAADTKTEHLEDFVKNADETTDPQLLDHAKNELKTRKAGDHREKSSHEMDYDSNEEDIDKLGMAIEEMRTIGEGLSGVAAEKVKEAMTALKGEHDSAIKRGGDLKAKIDEAAKDPIEKKPAAHAKTLGLDDLNTKLDELNNKATDQVKQGDTKGAQKTMGDQKIYFNEMVERNTQAHEAHTKEKDKAAAERTKGREAMKIKEEKAAKESKEEKAVAKTQELFDGLGNYRKEQNPELAKPEAYTDAGMKKAGDSVIKELDKNIKHFEKKGDDSVVDMLNWDKSQLEGFFSRFNKGDMAGAMANTESMETDARDQIPPQMWAKAGGTLIDKKQQALVDHGFKEHGDPEKAKIKAFDETEHYEDLQNIQERWEDAMGENDTGKKTQMKKKLKSDMAQFEAGLKGNDLESYKEHKEEWLSSDARFKDIFLKK